MFSRVLCLLSAGVLLAQPAADPKDTARKAVDLLLAHKYSDLGPLISQNSKAANTEAELAKKVSDAWGPVQTIGVPAVRPLGTASMVTIPVKFANQDVSYESPSMPRADRIDPSVGRSVEASRLQQTGFVQRARGHHRDAVEAGGHAHGAERRGAVPGSRAGARYRAGRPRRAERLREGLQGSGRGLASKGVVVLRYEKRTRAYPSVTQKEDYTAQEEIIDDAVLAAGVLRAQPEVKPGRVFELGFGLGGYLMPRIAEADGKLAGMIVVNGNERPLEDLALDEMMYLDEDEEKTLTGPKLEQWHRQMAVFREQAAKIKKLTSGDVDTTALLWA
jgi:hypothetical protein